MTNPNREHPIDPDRAATLSRFEGALRAGMEAIVLAMAALAPWAFASVHPLSIFALYICLSSVLCLWGLAAIVGGRRSLHPCPVLLCLGGMVTIGVCQLVPLSPSTLESLSPATVSLRSSLYPQGALESVVGDETVYPSAPTISLEPDATRNRVVELLAVLALYAAVRFGLAGPSAFRRFAVVCIINGSLLSAVALAQRFSSPPEVIYWTFPASGKVFGPFVCKNHFPDYANVCMGLAVGLVLQRPPFGRHRGSLGSQLQAVSQDPLAPWLIAAAGLMVTAVLFSMSRGGVLALAAGGLGGGLLLWRTGRLGAGLGLAGVVVLLAIGITNWLGSAAIADRLGTLSEADSDRGRREVWGRVLPLAARFPLLGTGLGTFDSTEPQTREPGDIQEIDWDHAHNEYLEALVEGGAVNLLFVLIAATLVFRHIWHALQARGGTVDKPLLIGGMIGFGAVVVHSLSDFGLQIPAVTVLVTVLAAHLMAAADPPSTQTASRWRIFPALVTGFVVAFILPVQGWYRERADYYRLAAVRAKDRLEPGDRDAAIRYLEAAATYCPEDALIRMRLANARYDEYMARRASAEKSSASGDLDARYLRPALRDYLILRSINPLYEVSHARLAANRQHLRHPDAATAYLDRAVFLRPTDPDLWYLAGLDRLTSGDPDRAWAYWRNSLRCSSMHLEDVVGIGTQRLSPTDLAEKVMIPKPDLLVRAAQSPPLSDAAKDRQAFAIKSVELIAGMNLTAAVDLRARAWLLREAGRKANAVAVYEAALDQAPENAEWRLELAGLLFESGDFRGAQDHLRRVLHDRPDLAGAKELNASVVRAQVGIR